MTVKMMTAAVIACHVVVGHTSIQYRIIKGKYCITAATETTDHHHRQMSLTQLTSCSFVNHFHMFLASCTMGAMRAGSRSGFGENTVTEYGRLGAAEED